MMNPRIISAKYQSKYHLIIKFDNGEIKQFDFSEYLHYPIFEMLKDETFCNKARVINGTVAWSDDIDFDPDTLYLESVALS